MTHEPHGADKGRASTLQFVRRSLLALCLGAMVAGFATLGALAYQGWKVFHNPYHRAVILAEAPSAEAARWAADVYRREKEKHSLITGLIEVGLILLSTGAWLGYKQVDKHLDAQGRSRRQETQRIKGPRTPTPAGGP